ncbi:hypothetical protein JKP88DRAFT_347162 [Tribonema minus]|uniref:Uncharacterized protein n=1 Tax=Tribonema minus TaxID=303371 RepID=A0A835YJS0_9STRA|nr:hypothetical protein JKP88DRAFT_347162 [Tribonema minus]
MAPLTTTPACAAAPVAVTMTQVCNKVLRALQLNDDLTHGHGAAAMVKFALQRAFPSPLVCDKVLRALQLNDDPMLDYGAAVMVKFASPLNAAAALTPSQYGGYLRAGEFEVLLENSRFGLSGPLRMAESGKRCVQRATVVGPPPALTKFEFDIQLSRTDVPEKGECWLIDTVTRHSV